MQLTESETEKIWMQFHDKLLCFIQKRVADKAAAEDILQDVFVKIHNSLASLSESKKIESWVYQITRNAIIDYYRGRKLQVEIPDWLEAPGPSDEDLFQRDISGCMASMLRHLPDKYRMAVQLADIEGKSQKEIAEQEAISLSGAKSRVQRGRLMLRQVFEQCCTVELSSHNSIVDCIPESGECDCC